jgi:hypothetical protein
MGQLAILGGFGIKWGGSHLGAILTKQIAGRKK